MHNHPRTSRQSFEHPIIPDQRADDLHGIEHADNADLTVFMAGNQFMAMPRLMAAFRERHPEVERIFLETLPPKLELQQILSGGAMFRGYKLPGIPDVYTSVSQGGVDALIEAGLTRSGDCFVYLRNALGIMVAEGNPKGISGVTDLGRQDTRVSQPNPRHEDIAEYILAMYRAAGGEALETTIMGHKVEAGTTLMTTVHHRETPERLLGGEVDAGPVWVTEIENARREGRALEGVAVGPELDQRDKVAYLACPVSSGRNPENGHKFLDFLASKTAATIYSGYGFIPRFE